MKRIALLMLAAFLSAIAVVSAGELFRPVPADAKITRFTRFNISYSLRDSIAAGVQKVEFYMTEDMGKTWTLYGEDPDRQSPMTIQVPGEGVYGFVCVVTDRYGNREREPGPRTIPETVIVVDRTPPQAKWISPDRDVVSRSKTIEFKWEASDKYFGPGPVRIEAAMNATSNMDRNAAWRQIAVDQPDVGSFTWTPPTDATGRFNFRLIAVDRAGLTTTVYCAATLIIDNVAPVIKDVTPLKSNKLDVDVTVDAEDNPSGSGIDYIALYTSSDNGVAWDLMKDVNENQEPTQMRRMSGQPFPFKAAQQGSFGLWPVAVDRAGNVSPLPRGGIIGPYVLVIDNEPPQVTLSNSFMLGQPAILANDYRLVDWTAFDPHLEPNSAILSLSMDGGQNWQELQRNLPSSGSWSTIFPSYAAGDNCKLRVAVSDEFGNVGYGVSESFRISPASTVIDSVTPYDQSSSSSVLISPPSSTDTGGLRSITDDSGSIPPLSHPSGSPGDIYDGGPSTDFDIFGTETFPSGSNLSSPQPTPDALPPPANFPMDTPQYPAATDWSQPGTTDWNQPGGTFTAPLDAPFPSAGTALPAPGIQQQPHQPLPGEGESTASVFPSSMTKTIPGGGRQPTPTTTAPALPQQPAIGTGTEGWVASPQTPPAPVFEPQTPVTAPPQTPMAQPDWGTPTIPQTQAAPTQPPAWESSFGTDISAPPATPTITAPPVSDVPSTFEAPQAPNSQGGSLFGDDPAFPAPSVSSGSGSFDASDFAMPDWDTQTPAATAPAPALIPSTPTAAPDAPQSPAAPATVTEPPSFNLNREGDLWNPSNIPQAPSIGKLNEDVGVITEPSSSPLIPSDPRQLSAYYAEESKKYIDEGRLDLALDSANKAINADTANPVAHSRLAQVYVQQDPADYAKAAVAAREAIKINDKDWYAWYTCADVYYRWAYAKNKLLQPQIRTGQIVSPDELHERDQGLNNAQVAIQNAALLVQNRSEADRDQVAQTQGEIAYLKALVVPEPVRPNPAAGAAAQADYARQMDNYRYQVVPLLRAALPFFQAAAGLGGPPLYREEFHLGIINFRLGGMAKDAGNMTESIQYYDEAARHLEAATTAAKLPPEGPREAFYMLAYCHDQLAEQPGRDRVRQLEMALRYWRQTSRYYEPGTTYRDYSDRRIDQIMRELGLQ